MRENNKNKKKNCCHHKNVNKPNLGKLGIGNNRANEGKMKK